MYASTSSCCVHETCTRSILEAMGFPSGLIVARMGADAGRQLRSNRHLRAGLLRKGPNGPWRGMDNVPWYGLYCRGRTTACGARSEGGMLDGMTIGRLAKSVGEHVETIRYYQRRGLIEEPRKPASGHRRYPGDVVNRIRFIRRAQQMGFSLEEVKSLLKLSDGRHPREVRQIAERKQDLLEAR